jgi:hypothetical protein
MATLLQARRAYDHRLRDQVRRDGTLAQLHELRIPRLTAASWRSRGSRSVATIEKFGQGQQQLLDRIEKLTRRKPTNGRANTNGCSLKVPLNGRGVLRTAGPIPWDGDCFDSSQGPSTGHRFVLGIPCRSATWLGEATSGFVRRTRPPPAAVLGWIQAGRAQLPLLGWGR